MKASDVKISDLKHCSDCYDAIESIEMDHRNVVGGLKAFNSGYETHLTRSAELKIDAINRKLDKLSEKLEDY